MKFGLSEEQVLLQDSLTRFLAEQVPLSAVRSIAANEKDDTSVWQGLTDLGIPGLLVPEKHGGIGLGAMDAAIVSEVLGYHVTPSPFLSSSAMAVTAFVGANYTDLLADIAAGTCRVGIAFGEAIGARDKAGIAITDHRLTGKAIFSLDATADHYLIATPEQHLYLVAASALHRQALTTIDITRTTCELVFDSTPALRISEDARVYEKTLDIGRIMLAADTLGAAQNMLNQAVAYSKQREQFDRPIATFQAVKHMCAEMAAGLEPCRAMSWYTAHAFDHLPDEARFTACQTKAHISEVGKFVARTATEVHGGMGFTDLVGLHYWFKRIGFNRQLLGSPELLREEAAKLQGLAA